MSLRKDITEPEMKRARQGESESEGNEDRISDLPDSVVHHILSFVRSKDAVRTCILSRRWMNLWKSLPTLVLRANHFRTLAIFSKFVSRLLSLRDGSVSLRTLDFQRHGTVEPHILKRVIKYAISHNVQQLGIDVQADIIRVLPSIPCIFYCQTLTSLKLSVYRKYSDGRIVFPKSLNLPALTSLHLKMIEFCASDIDQAEPFSNLKRLNNLVIDNYILRDAQIFCICSTTLSSLTLIPKHESSYNIVLSTPNLSSFAYTGVPWHDLSESILCSLEQVYICAYTREGSSKPPIVLLNWLKALANVQSLTVAVTTIQVLLLIPDLLNIKLPSLGNLKSLQVKMFYHPPYLPNSQDAIPHGILDFFRQNSLSAEVTII